MSDRPRIRLAQLMWLGMLGSCILLGVIESSLAQSPNRRPRGIRADKPLFRDPVFDGAADPVVVWNFAERKWYMFYTNRRANLPDDQIDGVNWVHGTKIGIAESRNGAEWTYVGTANISHGGEDATYWAPEVIYGNGSYHMYLTVVPGVFRDWQHPRSIVHLTSQDLMNWEYQSTLKLASDRVIDACVVRLVEGGWRMWYNNEVDRKSIYYADSDDLAEWHDRGKATLPNFPGGEGPKVFYWDNWYWMVLDVWDGLAVYLSKDALDWTRQPENLLQIPGQGADDGVKGQHADVVATRDRAYIFYFTHPGRVPGAASDGYQQRRSSIQIAELKLDGDTLTCDRDAPVRVNLRFRFGPQIHDPSTIQKMGDRYWCFSTGRGVQALSSEDLTHWKLEPPLFDGPPEWVDDVVPNFRGSFWAPDVILWQGRYLVYYSVSAFGKRTSAIALASSPTLDPAADDYGWTDHGIVVQTDEDNNYNAIDPAVIATPDGELWLTFGSYWSGIKLIQLDPQTGKRLQPDSPMYSLAKKEQIEAASIYFHDGYYYLFVDWGICCRGVRSTYNIRVGRSRAITGPYVDRDGVDLLEGGGTLVLDTVGPAIGPGHAGFFEHDGQLMFTYHFYNAEKRGLPELGISRLRWDAQGWPEVESGKVFTGSIARDE